jgi:hypothetical protein
MSNLTSQRIRPARIISLVSMMILFGSAARADVARVLSGSAPVAPQFSPALASSLALSQQQVVRETSGLRLSLDLVERHRLAIQLARKHWSTRRAVGSHAVTVTQSHTVPVSAPRSSHADWYAIAACESGGRWALNTGNGFYGGLQFTLSTWSAYGGGPFNGVGAFPYSASQQIAVAERVLTGQGPGAWPNCFRWA